MLESSHTDNSLKQQTILPQDVFNDVINKFKQKKVSSINEAKNLIHNQCLHNLPLLEPYLVQIMDIICSEDSYISNKNKFIRESLYDIMKLILEKMNINAVTILLQSIYKYINSLSTVNS